MRFSVGCSVVVHVLVVLGALRLPAPAARRAPSAIEIDINKRPPPVEVKPVLQPATVVKPQPLEREPRVATREVREPKRVEEEKKHEEETPTPPPPTQPQQPPPQETPSPLSPRAGKPDLLLHGLPQAGPGELGVPSSPNGSPNGVIGGSGSGGTIASARKPWKPRLDAGNPLTGKVAEEKKEDYPLTPIGRDGFVYKGPQFSAHISMDGSVSFDDKYVRDFKGLSGTFDITDITMKAKKEDPYRHEKKKFLAATEEMRAKLAKQARQEEMQNSLAQLPVHLETIWQNRSRTPKQNRELLFQLWKEAAVNEDDRASAASEARKIIEEFIRRRLPQGSAEAYTDEELEALSRAGRVRFDPYK